MAHIFDSIHHAVRSCFRFMMPVQRGSAEDERRIRFKVFLLNLFTLSRRKRHERRAEACATWLLHVQEEAAARVRVMHGILKERRLRVAFLVIYDSIFPAEKVYRKMRDSRVFEPVLYVIPDTFHDEQNMLTQMFKTYKSLKEKYGEVILPYDKEHKTFYAIDDDFDIFCTANPYDGMTHENYGIRHLVIERGKLSFYINYGYPAVAYARIVFSMQSINLVWKYFIESEVLFPEYCQYELLHGLNTKIVGYAKMDDLAHCRIDTERTFKRVIIAPHHTIDKAFYLHISNFLAFADFFLELPARYPEVKFVFRPHPLLFQAGQ